MRKKKKPAADTEPKENTVPRNSANVTENAKYIKKLELQRLVLNKLVSSDRMLSNQNNPVPDSTGSN
ncbi:MAG: hypothetical protein HZA79_03455 [Sphingobacteriales bacterium]|nr:hypothetical protein [Sphingobacteriales bacterium]